MIIHDDGAQLSSDGDTKTAMFHMHPGWAAKNVNTFSETG